MEHSKKLGRDLVKRAKRRHGHGWGLLSEQQQRAFICEEIVHVLLSQANDPATTSALTHCQAVARAALYPED